MSARGSEVLDAIMLERMAKAMMEVAADAPPGRSPAWHYWLPDALAALVALREPTPAMEQAGSDALKPYDADDCPAALEVWQAMIDAALAEAEKLAIIQIGN